MIARRLRLTIQVSRTQPQVTTRMAAAVLGRLIDDGMDLARLNGINPDLASRLDELSHGLDSIPMPDIEGDIVDLPIRAAHQPSEAD
jgi:hypothetical protein